jgi:hypothetical protein
MAPIRTNAVEPQLFAWVIELSRKLYGLGVASAVVIVPTSQASAIAKLWREIWSKVQKEPCYLPKPAKIVGLVKNLTSTKEADGRMTLREFEEAREPVDRPRALSI